MRRHLVWNSFATLALGAGMASPALAQLGLVVETPAGVAADDPSENKEEKSPWSEPIWQKAALSVGDAAPAIDIEHWISDGGGKFSHIKEFEKGKVYIVEFWSMGCGPCIQAMPHISELQQKFADRGVQIISVTDEPLEAVNEFLPNDAPESGGKTFAEVTENYCLASDPDRSTSQAYMEAARRYGIPQAFLIGKDGKVEWVGHPLQLDEVLEQVVSDKWDRQAFADTFAAEQQLDAPSRDVQQMAANDVAKANAMIDELVAAAPSEPLKKAAEQLRSMIGVNAYRECLKGDQAKAGEMLAQLAGQGNGQPFYLANLVVPIEQMVANGEEVQAELYEPALKAVDEAIPTTEGFEKEVYRCLRVRLLQAKGELDQAIKEEEALLAEATAPEKKKEYQGVLDQLQLAKRKAG